MHYNVITLKDGSFAVDAGRGKYFTNTVTKDKDEAQRQAMIRTMAWHEEMIRKTFERGKRFGLFEGDNPREYMC